MRQPWRSWRRSIGRHPPTATGIRDQIAAHADETSRVARVWPGARLTTHRRPSDRRSRGFFQHHGGILWTQEIEDVGRDEAVERSMAAGKRSRSVDQVALCTSMEPVEPGLAQRHHRVADVGAEVAGIGGQVAVEKLLGQAAGPTPELEHRTGGRERRGGDELGDRRSS